MRWSWLLTVVLAIACSGNESGGESSGTGSASGTVSGTATGPVDGACEAAGGYCQCAGGCEIGSVLGPPEQQSCPQPGPSAGACSMECCVPVGGSGSSTNATSTGSGSSATSSTGMGTASTGGSGGQPLECTDDPNACPAGYGCACGGPGPGPWPCHCGLDCGTDDDCTEPGQPVCCSGTCTDDCTCYCN